MTNILSTSKQTQANEKYFIGGGEMGTLMRAVDWSQTPLGPLEQWPQSLHSVLSVCLGSNLPMAILWGPQLALLCNDAFSLLLGVTTSPHLLGRGGREALPELWQLAGSLIEEKVMGQGEPVSLKDQRLYIDRKSVLEACVCTFSFTAIRDEQGGIDGVFCVVTETRPQVNHEPHSDERMEKELVERVLSSLNDHFVMYDRDWRYTYVNDAAARMLGKSKEQLLGHCIWDLFPDAVGNQYYQALHRALDEGHDITFEHYYQPWDTWVENRLYASPDGVSALSVDITARKKAEDALRQSEQRLDLALQLAKMVAWEWDIQQRAFTTSTAYADVFGQSSLSMAGEGFQIVHPADRDRHREKVQQALEGGGPYHSEFRIIRPDNGQVRWIEERGFAVATVEGMVQKLCGVSMDSTERKHSEEALRESEARFRTMADNAPVMIWITDPDGRCSYINQQWCDFTGQTFEAVLGFGWLRAVHLEDSQRLKESFLHFNQLRLPFQFEFRFRRHDDVYRWATGSATPRFDAEGEYLGYIGSVIDITERKQGEERLQILHQLSEAVNRAEAVEQIYELALAGLERILHVDRASVLLFDEAGVMQFQAWHGLSDNYRQHANGHSPWTSDAEDPQPILVPSVEEADLGTLQPVILGEGIRSLAFIPLVEQGRLLGKFMLYYNQPHLFSETEVQWAQTIARHVAHALQRKQAELRLQSYMDTLRELNATLEQRVEERTAELQRSNRELDQFAYVASHDLKAPLRAINLLASWIDQDAGTVLPTASREHLDKLRGRIRRIETLLDDLLAYSRAGRQRHPLEPVAIADLIQDVVEVLALPPDFVVHVNGSMPVIRMERIPLETVFRNLIGNSIKHHHRPLEGRVEIALQEHEHVVEFIVTDNGPGIDPAFHQRIFEMFQTLQPRDQVEGSGIGLAVVKKLVESRGGTIQVESSAGAGTTFRFTWPRANTAIEPGK